MPSEVQQLVEQFERNIHTYTSDAYVEASLRQEFLDPLFIALGWDVGNKQGWADENKEVVVEPSLRIDGRKKAPDYVFRVGPTAKFYVEAKRPKVNINTDRDAAYQTRRYGWNKGLPLCILTDFEEWAIYDTKVQPREDDRPNRARERYFRYDELSDNWEWLSDLFGKEAVWRGSLEAWVRASPTRKGSTPVDAAFLMEIERWREVLAREIARKNPTVSLRELNVAVQTTIDRIVFLRICEDRGTETFGSLRVAATNKDVYGRLLSYFLSADTKYNSGLFHFKDERGRLTGPDRLTPTLSIGDEPLADLILDLYPPISSFDFTIMGVELLGQVYEQFLGSVIELSSSRSVTIEEKPIVKKAGGVVYTPTAVVDYIIEHTVVADISALSPDVAAGRNKAKSAHPFRVLDPACGSGSFLIAVYQRLLDWYLSQYTAEPQKWMKGRSPAIAPTGANTWRLTTAERQRILLAHVYGVDIDPQAVEVAWECQPGLAPA